MFSDVVAGSHARGLPGAINWLAITALLAATDYNDPFRDWLASAGALGGCGQAPVAPCLGGQIDG